MAHVWHMIDMSLKCVWPMLDVCLARVCCLFGVCVTVVWRVCDVSLPCIQIHTAADLYKLQIEQTNVNVFIFIWI